MNFFVAKKTKRVTLLQKELSNRGINWLLILIEMSKSLIRHFSLCLNIVEIYDQKYKYEFTMMTWLIVPKAVH